MSQIAAKSENAEAQYHYVIVRMDAATWPAQLGHAAAESAALTERTGNRVKVGECNFVALAAKGAAELEKAKAQCSMRGILFCEVIETEGPYAGQLLAIGILPVTGRLDVLRWLPCIKVHTPS